MTKIPFSNNDFMSLIGKYTYLLLFDYESFKKTIGEKKSDKTSDMPDGALSEIVKKDNNNIIYTFGVIEGRVKFENGTPVPTNMMDYGMYLFNIKNIVQETNKAPYLIGTVRSCSVNARGPYGAVLEDKVVVQLKEYPTHKENHTMMCPGGII
ncbi:MAG: hypothetical protein ABIB43_06700 [archaeon]